MAHEKITIGQDDFAAWGKLVKTWATGRNYVDHDMTEANPVPTTEETPPKWPRPTSFTDFFDQCFKANVGLVYDDGVPTPVQRTDGIGLVVMQGQGDAFLLRLPPRDILLAHEGRFIDNTKYYRLPEFYRRMFGGSSAPVDPKEEETNTKVKRMTIHAERVGEYTLNTCG